MTLIEIIATNSIQLSAQSTERELMCKKESTKPERNKKRV